MVDVEKCPYIEYKIEKVVSEEKIRQLSRSIMDVLWFSLWNKAK